MHFHKTAFHNFTSPLVGSLMASDVILIGTFDRIGTITSGNAEE